MVALVSSPNEAIQNIKTFSQQAHDIDEHRLSAARAWYAAKIDGEWKFGPSKFIGYTGLDAHSYQVRDFPLDGRDTERTLAQWFVEVREGSELYDELWPKLTKFLAQFRKRPSALARVSVSKDYLMHAEPVTNDDLVKLLAAVYGRLSASEQHQFKQLIG
jgi:hypothetical protein